jgi:plastocyanin
VLPSPLSVADPLETTLTDEQQGQTPATFANTATLPFGGPIDAATRAGIAAAITDLIGCRAVADFPQRAGREIRAYPRFFDRFSDDLFRRYRPTQPLAERWWDSFAALRVIGPDSLDPSWLDTLQMLPDGRVLAVLTTNRPDQRAQVMVFVADGGRWLLDEFAWLGDETPTAPAPSPTSTSGVSTAPTNVVITLADVVFTPNRITIPAQQEVTVTLINEGVVPHSFVVADLGIKQEVAPGESVNVRLTAPAGSYRFVCDVPGHEAAGMVGVLDASATPMP